MILVLDKVDAKNSLENEVDDKNHVLVAGTSRAHALHLERDCTKGSIGSQTTLPTRYHHVQSTP